MIRLFPYPELLEPKISMDAQLLDRSNQIQQRITQLRDSL